ncbi:MAG: VOC family protein [Acidimicrobiia bacterium]
MPAPDLIIPGSPCWVELCTSDPDASAEFYRQVFGWDIVDPGAEFGGYRNFVIDSGPVAGFFPNSSETCSIDAWSVYLSALDAAATVDAALRRGADVIVPVMAIHDLGVMACITDSANAIIGIWEPGSHRGCSTIGAPGTPRWFELWTWDFPSAVDFYRSVFGCDVEVSSGAAEPRCATLGVGGAARASVVDATSFTPPDVPACWRVSFGTDDADATAVQCERLGGAIVAPARNTHRGRQVSVSDVTGAVFDLLGPIS